MKTNELRIGNWVNLIGIVVGRELLIDGDLRETEITGFILGNLLSFAPGKDFNKISSCSPIPLTEEWLVKFAFTPTDDNTCLAKEYVILEKPNDAHAYYHFTYESDYMERITVVRFVHQLQNLYFALTGEELIIKE